ncbi:MAG: TrmH family RNA methyltransferase [Ignavibacteria bacterium]|nr:TrmH family RNA methyltransferase [Ignavibacteria bacterium]
MAFQYLKSNDLFAKNSFEQLFEICSKPYIIADHFRNPENMGALIRLAANIGAQEVLFLDEERRVRTDKIRRAAASSFTNIPWLFANEADTFSRIPDDFSLVAIETAHSATNIYSTVLPDKAVFILGNENAGINESLLSKVHLCVYIPVPGITRSLNVTHAASVVLFEWLRQMMIRHKIL